MKSKEHNGGYIIIGSFIVALLLSALPLPDWAVNWRPGWVALVLIYWCMALPGRVGIGIGWMLGIILDVEQGTLLGQHALGLSILAYITVVTHQRMRVFPLIQQSILIGIYLLLFQLFILWIRGIMGIAPDHWTFWMPALTSTLIWPWLFIIMRDIRRKFNVF